MVINLKNKGKSLKFAAGCLLFFLVATFINGDYFLPMILGWLLHELGHMVAGRLVDVRLQPEVGLLGVGLKESCAPHGRAESVLAAGGVAANLIWALAAYLLGLEYYYEASMVLALVNLLPVLPLDGGKILRGILSRHFPVTKITAVLAYCGQVLAMVCVIAIFWFHLRLWLLLLPIAVYLLAAADYRSSEYQLAKKVMADYLGGGKKNREDGKITC